MSYATCPLPGVPDDVAATSGDPTPLTVEIGWVVVGRPDEVDLAALQRASKAVLDRLAGLFDAFDWKTPVLRRRGEASEHVAGDTVTLLDIGASERDANRWDAALVVTDEDLKTIDKPFAMAAPSRAMTVAAISTARIDPEAAGETDTNVRIDVLAKRLEALALHLIGHLLDAPHSDDDGDFMHNLTCAADLDRMRNFGLDAMQVLTHELNEVADARIEERMHGPAHRTPIKFHLRVLFHNTDDIFKAVVRMAPWEFPLRLSKLTTAAASTLFILLMTAEAWELGMSQRWWVVLILSVLTLGGTSHYIILKQRLLVQRGTRLLSEQRAVGNLATIVSIVIGMATTYAVLFGTVLLAAWVIYPPAVVGGWAASIGEVGLMHYLTLAGFIASLGIVIGSLGAGFEKQQYFRHVALVDEET
ncbi:MAG: hypothetical protein AAGD32_07545 [Planctomycetota bacterium]